MNSPALSLKEWSLAIFILALLFSLILYSLLTYNNTLPEIEKTFALKNIECITVSMQGAVKQPGIYKIEKGTSVKTLLQQVELDEDADLSALNLEKKMRKSQLLFIPKQGYVIFSIEGAIVNPGSFTFPIGTKVSDLKNLILFKDDADLSFLKSRRKIKQGETIIVPRSSGYSQIK